MCAPGAAYFRFSWQVGDGDRTVNQEAYAAGPSANGNFREIDLGLITIPPVTAGTQAWDGILEGKAADAYTVSPWSVDYLVLVPVEAGYGRARGQTETGAGVVAATDGFAQAAGALNAKTMALGGAWATSGSGADYQVDGSGNMSRTAGSDGSWAGRVALAGTTNYTDVDVAVRMWGFNLPATHPNAHFTGLLVRYVDANNWLGVFANTGQRLLNVYKNVAGTKTLVGQSSGMYAPLGNSPLGVVITVYAKVASTGAVTARALAGNAAVPGDVTVTFTDPVLATGGTLATGKTGLYAQMTTAGSIQVFFDDFTVVTNPVLAPAMYSGRTLEVTGADVRRQNSAGTTYGRPGSYRGSRFVLNPEGSAGRSTRVLAKAWRNDVDLAAEATPVTDSLKAQVFYRPRYSVVPR